MNIFISWSGVTSMLIAEKLKRFIPRIIQSAKPYYSPDMDKGIKWEAELNEKLRECVVGLICLTKDNTEKPWILFEAGALSNRFESSKVCSIAFGIKKSEITRPLSTFQLTEFEKSDFLKLLKSINSSLETLAIDEIVLEESFDAFYPKFEEEVQEILKNGVNEEMDIKPERSEKDILEEILDLVRKQGEKMVRNVKRSADEVYYYDKGGRKKITSGRAGYKLDAKIGDKALHKVLGMGTVIRTVENEDGVKDIEIKFEGTDRIYNFPDTTETLILLE